MKYNKAKYLIAISAITLMGSSQAMATDMKSSNEVRAEAASTGDVSKDAKAAWKDIKHDVSEASKKFEAYFLSDDEKIPAKKMSYSTVSSAGGMISSPVLNYKDERIGTVKDIIVNSSGKAELVIIADGEFPGFDGKLVAFDYADVSKGNADGDVIIPISEETLNKAAEFSYVTDTGNSLVRYVPSGGYSVAKILKGDVLNSKSEKVGVVEDLYLNGGRAVQIIIGFDKVLDMGGSKVAANYQPTNVVFDGDALHIELTEKQSAALSNYKKSSKK